MPRTPTSSRGWRGQLLCASLALSLGGCSYSAGVSVLPTRDTNGETGIEARVVLSSGISNEWPKRLEEPRTGTVMPSTYGGFRKSLSESSGACASLGAGLQYENVARRPTLVGIRAGTYAVYGSCDAGHNPKGASLQLAPLFTLQQGDQTNHGYSYVTLGPLLEAALIGADASDPNERGRFGVGVTLDYLRIKRWTLAM